MNHSLICEDATEVEGDGEDELNNTASDDKDEDTDCHPSTY